MVTKQSKMDVTDDFLVELGKKITEHRTKNGQTLDDIEFSTGIDSSDVNKYEKGKINITIKTLIKIAGSLGVNPKELFDFDFDIKKYKIEE